jgi:hypothetical protein
VVSRFLAAHVLDLKQIASMRCLSFVAQENSIVLEHTIAIMETLRQTDTTDLSVLVCKLFEWRRTVCFCANLLPYSMT